jgi:hypothetical protein
LKLANPQADIQDMIFAVDPPAVLGEQIISVQKDEAVMKKLDDILTNSGISPSALNTYINCSLQYYFRYIAGLREQEDMEENLEAATIGSAVHFALEKIYTRDADENITVEYIQSVLKEKAKIEGLIRENLRELFDIEALSRGKNLLLYKVCVKLVEEFLKYELINLEQLNDNGASLKIEMLEGKLLHSLDIDGKEVKVQGRVDRIESINGVIHIADFKTSMKSTIPILNDEKTWDELLSNPKYSKPVQLMIYAWLYYRSNGSKDTALRSGIYWLRAAQKKLDTLRMSKESDLIDVPAILKFEAKLTTLLSELINPDIAFTKTLEVERCIYCEFGNICGRN